MISNKNLEAALDNLSIDATELYISTQIQERFTIPTALEFLRENVSKNLPMVIRNANTFSAIKKWNSKYFRQTFGTKEVTVTTTPNGYADGLAKKEDTEYFVMPEESFMTINDFLDKLDHKSKNVHYIQKQNSNFTDEFKELQDDIDINLLGFAREAFGKEPDAVNFWMGDERAVTSMHKDPYENMYCVISGYKDFTLIAPTDLHLVPRSKYHSAIYETDQKGDMQIKPLFDDNKPRMIEWVSVDPLAPDYNRFPNFKKVNIFRVRVHAGDILYLPSLWYHHVQQSHKCIALNFWFDMDYDSKYCYYKMIEKICGFGEDL